MSDRPGTDTHRSGVMVGAPGYEDKPWHTAGGARYYMSAKGTENMQDVQRDVLAVRPLGGAPSTDNIIDDSGKVPFDDGYFSVDGFSSGGFSSGGNSSGGNSSGGTEKYQTEGSNVRQGMSMPSLHGQSSSHTKPEDGNIKEGFWYDMNRIDEPPSYRDPLTDKYEQLAADELEELTKWGVANTPKMFRNAIPASAWGVQGVNIDKKEGFGNNRSAAHWDEKNYPMVTSNNLDITDSFPQSADWKVKNITVLNKIWGEVDPVVLE
jgi:hypothetical protein